MKPVMPLVAIGFASFILPAVAAAQPSERRLAAGAPQQAVPPAPPGRSEALLDGMAFDLSVSDEKSEASVQIGGYRRTQDADGDGADDQFNDNWSLRLALPIGGGDDLTEGSTFDALTDGPELTFTYSFFNFRSAAANLVSNRFKSAMRTAAEICREREQDDSVCTEHPDPDFAIRYSGLGEAAINRMLYPDIWRFGVEASIGLERFEYFDTATLAELDDTEVGYSAAVFVALYPSDAMSAWILKAQYQNHHEAEDARVICRAVVADAAEDCVHGIPAAPTNVERLNLSVEHRRVFETGWGIGDLAISPKATLDALSGEYALELPVYLVTPSEWPVSPGVRISYESDKAEVDFGVFLRTTFSF